MSSNIRPIASAAHTRRAAAKIPAGNYGAIIREYRKKAGMEQEELGSRLGYTKNAVHNWETGKSRPDLDVIPVLCRILGIPLDQFFVDAAGSRLSPAARHLAETFMSLDPIRQEMVTKMVTAVLDAEQQEKRRLYCRLYTPISEMLYGASAGTGSYMDEADAQQKIYVKKNAVPRGTDAIFHVSGHSMEPTYHDGQQVYVRYTDEIRVGQIGIFLVNGESYIKEYGREMLLSHNPDYEPVRVYGDDTIRCIGVVLDTVDENDVANRLVTAEIEKGLLEMNDQ